MKIPRGYPADVAVALALTGLVTAGAAAAPPGRTGLDVLGYLLLVVASLAVAGHRRAPAVVLLITTGLVLVYFLRGYPGAGPALPMLIALFSIVRAGHRWVALAPVAAFVVVVLADVTVVDQVRPVREVVEDRVLLFGWLVAAAMMGSAFRGWSCYVREVEQRAAEAERSREETARRRAGDERLRIARELHDSLTHNISIIKVQAGVAVHLARKRGEPVSPALLAMQDASAEAMRELRATLEVLRHTGEDGEESEGTGNGLDRLPGLISRARGAGVPATLKISGPPRDLPPGLDQAAYRIVQEALTNITRHAGPATAEVHLTYGPDELVVQIDDDGLATPAAAPVPGVGLIGMRERVAALGGRLRAEPRPEGGFSVRAELPIRTAVAQR